MWTVYVTHDSEMAYMLYLHGGMAVFASCVSAAKRMNMLMTSTFCWLQCITRSITLLSYPWLDS